ncbi:hypothetical protein GPJ56_001196 [Histomonas meleagridis]|uniref:uncharacterized protein n=1 Tax=Histomonas meleagridis TaxID=135588 RepID=UPI00355A19FD|nr:hypothetical protein GPJ56_001196 [Histomonas meleagridis]KAH0799841.1 hypothetical protein GO595_006953 [Histomonas meleagridis]
MNNSQVFVRNDGVWLFHCVANIFSHKGIQVLSIVRDTLLLRQGTVGIEKLEKNPDPNRDSNQMISFKYEVNRQNAIGFRDAVLESLKFPLNARKTNESKLLVIMIDRQTSHRRIVNQDEVVELMRNTCDFCDVRCIKFESLKVQEQISLVSKASVLVGLHGSGLAHVMWMHESTDEFPTYMIEVLPFGYICRDWYKVAANAAGVNYYAIMNKRAPSNSSSQLITCFNYPKLCSEVICHDSLRDQCVQLELKTFNQTWSNIVSELRKKL